MTRLGRPVALAALLAAAAAQASGGAEVGGLPGGFLDLSLSARSLGIGGADVATPSGASSILSNPAGLGILSRGSASAGAAVLFQGARYGFAAAAYPTLRHGGFGLAAAALEAGDATLRDESGTPLGQAGAAHSALLAGYGRGLGPVTIGGSLELLRFSHGAVSDTGGTARVGAHLAGVRISPALSGLTLGVRASGVVPATFGASQHPLSVRAGAAYTLLAGSLIVAAQGQFLQTAGASFAAGAEYGYRGMIYARAGWDGRPAAGIGFRAGELAVDYAAAVLELGVSHRASLSFALGPDYARPRILLREPEFGSDGSAVASSDRVKVRLSVESREPLASVRIAGRPMKLADPHRFVLDQTVGVADGRNPFSIDAVTVAGQRTSRTLTIIADTKAPAVDVVEPKAGARIARDQVAVKIVVSDASDVMVVTVNDVPAFFAPSPRVETSVVAQLPYAGRSLLRVAATDRAGHTRVSDVEVFREGGPPAPSEAAPKVPPSDEPTAKLAMAKGKEYLAVGRFDLAVAELRYALKLAPTLDEAKRLLEKAEQELTRAAPAAPAGHAESQALSDVRQAIETHFMRGKQLYDLGQYKRAQIEFNLVLELNKQYGAAIELLAKCRTKLEEYTTQKLVEAKNARSRGQLAKEIAALRDALSQDDNHPEASKLMSEARTRIPDEKRRLHLRALEFYAADKMKDAVALWREARELDPDDDMIRRSLEKAELRLIEMQRR